MKDKKELIIESAIPLFAAKGYESTSIQEIVDASGISKGAFYLHFKSKDALLHSIFEYYLNKIKTRIIQLDTSHLSPREEFISLLAIQFDETLHHRDFIIMHTREQSIPFNEEIAALLKDIHDFFIGIYQKSFYAIYGDDLSPYIWDVTLVMEGLFSAFMNPFCLFKTSPDDMNYQEIATYFLNRIDSIVEGLLHSGEEPLYKKIECISCEPNLVKLMDTKQIIIQDIDKELTNHQAELQPNLIITLEILREELNLPTPRLPIIQGMLYNLKNNGELPELQNLLNKYVIEISE